MPVAAKIVRRRPASQASYLKESDTPFSTFMSICVTSATRRSRSEPAAVFYRASTRVLPRRVTDADHLDDLVNCFRLLLRHRILPRLNLARWDVNKRWPRFIHGTRPELRILSAAAQTRIVSVATTRLDPGNLRDLSKE